MKKLLARLVRQSPAMVVAVLALFVALTGTAVATTSALITGKQIANSSITGVDVKNKSLTPKDFRGSVRGPRGLRGLTGATGAAGPEGPPNPNAQNSDKLDGFDANALLRVVSANDGTGGTFVKALSVGAYGTIATVNLTAPSAGYVLVVASAFMQHSAAGTSTAYLRVRDAVSAATSPRLNSYLAFYGETSSVTHLFPVAAGARSFVLEGYGNDANWAAGGATITALFVPFGPSGA